LKIPVKRALLSLYDKSGLVELAAGLAAEGVELVSSGGTASAIEEAGLSVTRVDEVTGAPEILGGRVKTLHPRIHGGILARPGLEEDEADLDENGIEAFQLVVVNLYPFRETVADPDATPEQIIEKIDIGGPTMVRAAAKNHAFVGVVTDPGQYDGVLEAVRSGGLDDELRLELAQDAFFSTASYDAAIVSWLGRDLVLPFRHHAELRYGENPHQSAAVLTADGVSPWWAEARQYQGKEMSFNNFADADAAWALVNDAMPEPSVAIIKHTNACGFAYGADTAEVFQKAWDCDPLSAFGSVVAINTLLDVATARLIAERFIEVVICTSVLPDALAILAKKTNLRVLEAPVPKGGGPDFRSIHGGLLIQEQDSNVGEVWHVVSEATPGGEEMFQMSMAMSLAMHTKSNAIVILNDGAAVGVGAGDQSRVGAARRALAQAGDRARGAVAASDAFFPFRDGLDILAEAGVTAIVEPGGSRNDQELIDAANEHGIALAFSGARHFKH
jgi:phosphoribosylaminoimidazolecarboxamide formyltransferase / IMP cyclohydrolase